MSRYIRVDSEIGPAIKVHNKVWTPELQFNHNNLGFLYNEQLGLPSKEHQIKLYDGSEIGIAPAPLDFWRNGYRVPFSNTLHVPIWEGGNGISPVHRLIVAGVALAINRNGELMDGTQSSSPDLIHDLVQQHAGDIQVPGRSYALTEALLK